MKTKDSGEHRSNGLDSVFPTESRYRFPVESLEALRKDPRDRGAFERIHGWCLCYVQKHREFLSHEDCLDIVSEAVMEELDALRPGGPEPAVTVRYLVRALHRNRMRAKRQLQRQKKYQQIQSAPASRNSAEERIEAEHLLKVARILKGFIGIAVESLSDRDYILICTRYDLGRFGFKSRSAGAARMPQSPGANKVALCRARIRLMQQIKNRLLDASTFLEDDRKVIDDALKMLHEVGLERAINSLSREQEA